MPDGLYEHDALAWAEHQAGLLSQLAAGERLNETIDWPNVIDEVRDAGLSELRSCRSLLRQALSRLLKLAAWPDSSAAARWRASPVNAAEMELEDFGSQASADGLVPRTCIRPAR